MTAGDIVLFTLKCAGATFLLTMFAILILSGIQALTNWSSDQ